MKDVIVDVMELQREKIRLLTPTDYKNQDFGDGFMATRFVFECGMKLNAQPITLSTAAVLLHRFFREVDPSNYDCYLVGAATIYLAGKVRDDPMKIRDVINVSHNTLHRGSSPLELGDEFWNIRDAIVQAELLIMRILKFQVNIVPPHKYMLHYLKSLEGWLGLEQCRSVPVARAAHSFLQDFHHSSNILNHSPQHVAIACVSLALQCYGIRLPLTDESEETTPWYSVFTKDLDKDKQWEIMEQIMDVYNVEVEL